MKDLVIFLLIILVNVPEVLSQEDFEFDLKLDDIKLKDYIGKAENSYKKLINNLKDSSNSFLKKETGSSGNKYGSSSNRNYYGASEDNTNYGNRGSDRGDMEEVIREYEKTIEYLKSEHAREILEYRQKYDEMKLKYKPDIDMILNKKHEEIRELYFIIEKINELMLPVYDKFYQKNANWFSEVPEFKCKEIEKVNFLIHLVNKFFSDNKYLVELVADLQKEKNSLIEERNMPFVLNSIQKNNVLNEVKCPV